MIQQKHQIKIPYRLLNLSQAQRDAYVDFIYFKYQVSPIVKKSGLIAFNELPVLSKQLGITTKHLQYRIIPSFIKSGLINETSTGYELLAQYKLNNLYKLKNKTNARGLVYNPYVSIQMPFYDRKALDALILYYQLKDKANKIKFRSTNFKKVEIASFQKAEATGPYTSVFCNDDLKLILPLESLMKFGYTDKRQVLKLLSVLEKIKLVEIKRGKFNTYSLQRDCNQYYLNPVSHAKFYSLLRKETKMFSQKQNQVKVIKTGLKKPKTVRRKINAAEVRFSTLLESGLKECLIHSGHLSQFFSQRKVSRNIFPSLVAVCLNDAQLRNILLKGGFTFENFQIKTEMRSCWNYLANYHYERYLDKGYDPANIIQPSNGHTFFLKSKVFDSNLFDLTKPGSVLTISF